MDFKSWIINEEVAGNYATVFHRTKGVENGLNIFLKGFQPGPGDAYGPGLYTTFDLASQIRPGMIKTYGPYIIKFTLPLKGFVSFDADITTKMYGRNLTIEDQLKSMGITNYTDYIREVDRDMKHKDDQDEPNTTSRYASEAWSELMRLGIPGILFTGAHDGRVAVVYRTDLAKAVSFAHAPELDSPLKWEKFDPRYVKWVDRLDIHQMKQKAGNIDTNIALKNSNPDTIGDAFGDALAIKLSTRHNRLGTKMGEQVTGSAALVRMHSDILTQAYNIRKTQGSEAADTWMRRAAAMLVKSVIEHDAKTMALARTEAAARKDKVWDYLPTFEEEIFKGLAIFKLDEIIAQIAKKEGLSHLYKTLPRREDHKDYKSYQNAMIGHLNDEGYDVDPASMKHMLSFEFNREVARQVAIQYRASGVYVPPAR